LFGLCGLFGFCWVIVLLLLIAYLVDEGFFYAGDFLFRRDEKKFFIAFIFCNSELWLCLCGEGTV
jgi:hypothetical protein